LWFWRMQKIFIISGTTDDRQGNTGTLCGPLHHCAHKFTSSGLIGSGNPWPCTTSEGAIQCERSFAVVGSDRQEFGKRLRYGCRDCSLYRNQCFHDIVHQSYPGLFTIDPCTMRQSAAILPCSVISIFRDRRCMRLLLHTGDMFHEQSFVASSVVTTSASESSA
jgi:hypothetical protein